MMGLFFKSKSKQAYRLTMVKQEYLDYLNGWIGKLETKIYKMESRKHNTDEIKALRNNLRILKTCAKTFKGISSSYEQ
mgnify:FL=1